MLSATFFLAHIPQSRHALVLRLVAIGLAIFAVVGAETALLAAAEPVAAVAMGVITATFGGIIRDVLGGESPVVLRKEIYVTAALLGATGYVGLVNMDVDPTTASFCGLTTTLWVRLAALHWQWTLPRYRRLRNSR
ncbi:trimeric intracellular cation channel family protein [Pseudorhizobium marinum]|uniref:trimeric intracellular cation channel family protein n=1 Tax=Pseudorhizobium marinum TaxID=1496690 RepID=UPI00068B7C88|nr:TRIC cation channel family protein [Pseudorhizobium marinum]